MPLPSLGTFDPRTPPSRVRVVDDHPIILSGVELLLRYEPDFAWLGSAVTLAGPLPPPRVPHA